MNLSAPFKSLGHFFAKAYTVLLGDIPKIQATETTVETVTATIPVYGPLALTVEKAGYAALGEISAILHAGGDAAAARLADVGLDQNVVNTIKALIADPQVAAAIKLL